MANARKLTLLTYNVMGGKVRVEERAPAIFRILRDSGADVIALQEARAWFLDLLGREAWARAEYRAVEVGRAGGNASRLHMLARVPVVDATYRPLPSQLGRAVLVARFRAAGRRLAVATTHLDSFAELGETRARQLDAIFGLLADADDAVLVGDMNFADGAEPETSRLDASYVDVWRALRGGDPGFTVPAGAGERGRRAREGRRLDRILLRSEHWRPRDIGVVGDEPGPDGRFPSDHFGLVAGLEAEG